jgi:hypothetical protein
MPPDAPLDVVYTWVDSARADYLNTRDALARTSSDLNPERFRDPADMLRHSLRSLARFFPACGRIFIVTARPQVPAWLDLSQPRLRVVHHDEFFDDPAALPTFNSNVIESFLHLLPDISPRFLYLNDDYFLGAPVTPADFIAPDGRPRVFGTLVGEHFRSRVYEHQIPSFGLLEHGPLLVDRAEFAAALATAPTDLAALRRHRFRQPDDLRPDRLYRWHLLARRTGIAEPCWRYLRYARFVKLIDRPAPLRRQLARLAAGRPKFFCLNDDLGAAPSAAALAAIHDFLATTFPVPSRFERAPA